MALVGEASLLRNPGKGLIGPHQRLGALKPTLHDVALWTDPKRQLERAAEVIRTKTGDPSEIGQSQGIS